MCVCVCASLLLYVTEIIIVCILEFMYIVYVSVHYTIFTILIHCIACMSVCMFVCACKDRKYQHWHLEVLTSLILLYSVSMKQNTLEATVPFI